MGGFGCSPARVRAPGYFVVDVDADGKVQLEFEAPTITGKAPKADVAPVEEI